MSNDTKPDWQPPVHDEKGIALAGASQLPANHRLRAEALVAAGKKKDPDGFIPDDLIADTARRLQAEAPADPPESQPPAPPASKPTATQKGE